MIQITNNQPLKTLMIFLLFLFLLGGFILPSLAQNIGINITGVSPNASAALDIDMTNKGLLIPRIDLQNLTDVTTISSPSTSLLVYNTGATLSPKGYYYWDGTVWVPFLTNSAATNAGWSLTGNPNTTVGTHFLGTTDAKDFAIYTSNAERIRVLSGGNIGIGTTSPTGLLDVYGSNIFYLGNNDTSARIISSDGTDLKLKPPVDGNRINLEDGNTANALEVIVHSNVELRVSTPVSVGGDLIMITDTLDGDNGDFVFKAGATSQERVRIKGSGNVGIGTDSPSEKLTVSSGNIHQDSYSYHKFAIGNTSGFIWGNHDYNGTLGTAFQDELILSSNWQGVTGNTDNYSSSSTFLGNSAISIGRNGVRFLTTLNTTGSTIPVQRMLISTNGNVGIGTIAPLDILSVTGTSPAIRFSESDASGNNHDWRISTEAEVLGISARDDANAAGGNYFVFTRSTNQVNSFRGFNSNVAWLTFDNSSQAVGIGTTSPLANLQIGDSFDEGRSKGFQLGGTAYHYHIYQQSGGSGAINNAMVIDANGDTDLREGSTNNGTGRIVFMTAAGSSVGGTGASTEKMRIEPTGNVGIGTTGPAHNLHVIGTAGLSTGTAWTNTSDIRLKDIRGKYEKGLSEILNLNTVRFNYKKDNPLGLPSEKEIIGFVAQEVQKEIPEAVITRADGYLELNVDPIHWAGINAIKELNQKIETLQKDNEVLKSESILKTQVISSLQEEITAINVKIEQLSSYLEGKANK